MECSVEDASEKRKKQSGKRVHKMRRSRIAVCVFGVAFIMAKAVSILS